VYVSFPMYVNVDNIFSFLLFSCRWCVNIYYWGESSGNCMCPLVIFCILKRQVEMTGHIIITDHLVLWPSDGLAKWPSAVASLRLLWLTQEGFRKFRNNSADRTYVGQPKIKLLEDEQNDWQELQVKGYKKRANNRWCDDIYRERF
jgi:hypothetical protein